MGNDMPLKCPFTTWREFECIYKHNGFCEDIVICPGNSDAWCLAQIEEAEHRRAAPDADRAAAVDLVRELADYLLKLHGSEKAKGCKLCDMLARAATYLRGERSSGVEVARLQREAFVAGMWRMWAAGDYPRALNNFMEWAEAEALRRYPEKPQEAKPC
jgi:hypothetical protein